MRMPTTPSWQRPLAKRDRAIQAAKWGGHGAFATAALAIDHCDYRRSIHFTSIFRRILDQKVLRAQ